MEVRYNAHLSAVEHDWAPAIARCACGGWYAVQAATIASRVAHKRCYLGPESARFYLSADLRERLRESRRSAVLSKIAAKRAEERGSSALEVLLGVLVAALIAFAVALGGTVAP